MVEVLLTPYLYLGQLRKTRDMASALTIGLYIGIAALVVILAMGMINLTRTDDGQRSRSNQLMRMRVMVQAAVIGILVLLGIVLGAIKLF